MAARYSNNVMFSKGKNTPIESAQDGLWSAPDTWVGNKVPLGGRRAVIIRHNIGFDVTITRPLTLTKDLAGSLNRDSTLPPNLAQIGGEVADQLGPLLAIANAIQAQLGNLPKPLASDGTAMAVWNALAADYNTVSTMGAATQSGSGGGTAPTAVENAAAVRANLTPELTKITEMHKLQGLEAGKPMTVTPTQRSVDGIVLELSGDGVASTTVSRA